MTKYCHPAFGCDCEGSRLPLAPAISPESRGGPRKRELGKVNARLEEMEQAIAALLMAIMDYRYGPDPEA